MSQIAIDSGCFDLVGMISNNSYLTIRSFHVHQWVLQPSLSQLNSVLALVLACTSRCCSLLGTSTRILYQAHSQSPFLCMLAGTVA